MLNERCSILVVDDDLASVAHSPRYSSQKATRLPRHAPDMHWNSDQRVSFHRQLDNLESDNRIG